MKLKGSAMINKKPKVAVQIYGHLRTYTECAPNLKKFFSDKYDCDIFIHTWDTLDHTTKAWHKLNEGRDVIELNTTQIEMTIRDLYNPKIITVEKQIPCDFGNITDDYGQSYSIYGIYCMMQTMKKVNNLRIQYQKNHSVNYDFVVFTRPDIFLKRDFSIEKYTNGFTDDELNKNIFITGMNCSPASVIINDIRYYGGKDLLFFGRPHIITALFENEEVVFSDVKNVQNNKIYLSIIEYFFYQMLSYAKCKIMICDYQLGDAYEIKRLYG